jgi:hypothetical protein
MARKIGLGIIVAMIVIGMTVPFVLLISWFDKLITIGSFPNVLSEIERQVQSERVFSFWEKGTRGPWFTADSIMER